MKLEVINKLEKQVKEELEKIKVYEVLEHKDYTQASKDIAELRKLDKAINRKRIDFNKEFNNNVKKLLKPVNDKIDDFAFKIELYDTKYQDEKLTQIEALWQELGAIVELDMVWQDKFFNKTMTINQISDELEKTNEKIKADIGIIKVLEKDYKDLEKYYLQTLDITKARDLWEEDNKPKAKVGTNKYSISFETDEETFNKISAFLNALGVVINER